MTDDQVYCNALNLLFTPYQGQFWTELETIGNFRTLWERHGSPQINPQEEAKKLNVLGIKLITCLDADYPEQLRHLADPPLGLYSKGELALNALSAPLAIVGTRKAGAYGLQTAEHFGRDLGRLGCTIISGLAYGIDQAAHRGALEVGATTTAVLGESIDDLLNSPKRGLAEKIMASGGLLVSEYAPGQHGSKASFPLRNRIVAALSLGTLVIEAPIDSGALITARRALELGREVFVIPGEITNQNYLGSHRLIQQGAKLVTDLNDITTELGLGQLEKVKTLALSTQEEEIVEILKRSACDLTALQSQLSFDTGALLALLSHLEIKGIINNVGGKFAING